MQAHGWDRIELMDWISWFCSWLSRNLSQGGWVDGPGKELWDRHSPDVSGIGPLGYWAGVHGYRCQCTWVMMLCRGWRGLGGGRIRRTVLVSVCIQLPARLQSRVPAVGFMMLWLAFSVSAALCHCTHSFMAGVDGFAGCS